MGSVLIIINHYDITYCVIAHYTNIQQPVRISISHYSVHYGGS